MSRSIRHQRDFRCIVGMSNKSRHEVNLARGERADLKARRADGAIDLRVGLTERTHEVDHGPLCGCDMLEELEDERSLFPDEFVGLDDDEHPQPFASALWLAFLRLPR